MISTSWPATYVPEEKLYVTFTSKPGKITCIFFIHICIQTNWHVKSHICRHQLLLWHLGRLCYLCLRCQSCLTSLAISVLDKVAL